MLIVIILIYYNITEDMMQEGHPGQPDQKNRSGAQYGDQIEGYYIHVRK